MEGIEIAGTRTTHMRGIVTALLLGLLICGLGTVHGASGSAGMSKIVIGQPIGSGSMVLDEHTGHLFVATSTISWASSLVTMIDMRGGSLLRQIPVGVGTATLVLDPTLDRIYTSGTAPFSRMSTTLVPVTTMIDGSSGRLLATRQLAGDTGGMLQEGLIGDDAPLGRLFVAGGGGRSCTNSRCTTQPSQVRIIDARTLKTLAIIPVGNTPQASPLVDERNARVYVSTNDGTDVLDARSGKRLLRIPLTTRLLAVNRRTDRVYLAAGSNTLLLDGPTSQVLAVFPLSPGWSVLSSETLAVDPGSGRIYFAAARGVAGPVRLYEADGATGHEVHSCALGADPTAIALETGSDRVVVAGYSRSEVAVIDMAGCRVVQRIVAVAVPIAVAIDEKDGRLAIESSDAPPEPPPGRQPAMPTSTTVTIVPLMR